MMWGDRNEMRVGEVPLRWKSSVRSVGQNSLASPALFAEGVSRRSGGGRAKGFGDQVLQEEEEERAFHDDAWMEMGEEEADTFGDASYFPVQPTEMWGGDELCSDPFSQFSVHSVPHAKISGVVSLSEDGLPVAQAKPKPSTHQHPMWRCENIDSLAPNSVYSSFF